MQRCQPNRPKGDAAAEILGLGNEERPLKFGTSFTNPKATSFHTLKYDFKPASVDINKVATVDVGTNHQVTVTVPHLDGSGEPTVFKGSHRPYQKECVLIIDHVTGEMKLEKLSGNIQVKKTRKENMKLGAAGKPGQPGLPGLGDPIERLPGPPMRKKHTSTSRIPSGARQKLKPPPVMSSKSGSIPHHSPLPPSPSYLSPGHHQSPPLSGSSSGLPTLQSSPVQAASLPSLMGLDDFTPMDTRLDTRLDSRPDTRSDTRPDTRYDNRSDTRFDTRPDTRFDFRPDARFDARPDTRIDTRPDTRVDTRPDTRIDTRPDTRADTRPDTRVDTRPDTRPDFRPKESPDQVKASSRPIGSLSDSSSDSSSNSDSSSDSDSEDEPSNSQPSAHILNGQRSSPSICRPDHLLKEDLQLSESGSDSD